MPKNLNIVRGYHGTTLDVALSICQSGFISSHKTHLWLGEGVYFFQDAPALAWRWAGETTHRRGGTTQAVVGSMIDLKDCMDLLDELWNDFLHKAHRLFEERCNQDGIPIPIQEGVKAQLDFSGEIGGFHRLDCSVFNHAIQLLQDEHIIIRSIRGVFVEGAPLYKTAHLFSRSHVAIAVRDISAIQRPFLI